MGWPDTAMAALRIRLVASMAASLCLTVTAAEAQTNARPFEHRRHESVSCLTCHGTGAQHATYLVRTARDCAACHHDPSREQSCLTCHQRDSLPAMREVQAAMTLSGSGRVTTRTLTFSHDRHVADSAQLSCRDCHRAALTLEPDRECASCHSSHHTAKTTCTACHTQAPRGVHNAAVHLSCAGSGCHTESKAPSPTLSRRTCLACHRAQNDHEPDGICADCHLIPHPKGTTPRPPADSAHRRPGKS